MEEPRALGSLHRYPASRTSTVTLPLGGGRTTFTVAPDMDKAARPNAANPLVSLAVGLPLAGLAVELSTRGLLLPLAKRVGGLALTGLGTVLGGYALAVLIGGKPVSARAAGVFIPKIMAAIDRRFSPLREELLKEVHGNVLDLGCGSGLYFKYLTKKVDYLLAVEPNINLHGCIQEAMAASKTAETVGRVELSADFIENIEGDARFDWVILGNVLCEVPDPVSVVKNIDRLLRPGGCVFFCEHIGRARGTRARRFQDFINPFWHLVSDGCNCNRDTTEMLEMNTSWDIHVWNYGQGPLLDTFEVGLAVKPLARE